MIKGLKEQKKSLFIINMPSKSKKQQNYFRLIKAYADGGYKEFFGTWKRIFGNRPYPNSDYINKVIDISKKIKYADLEDLSSGVEGESVVGDTRDIKVGYWALFSGRYRNSRGEPKENTFISKIKRVDHNNKIVNFDIYDFYNRFGGMIEVPRRLVVTHPEFQLLDYAYFKDILKTGKNKKDVVELKPGTLVKEIFGDESFWDYTGTLAETGKGGRQTWEEMLLQRKKVLSRLKDGELEPQVKDAVERLNENGYITTSSGFIGHPSASMAIGFDGPLHTIDGMMGLSKKQAKEVKKSRLGDVVGMDNFIDGYQAIRVSGNNDLNEVKKKFDKIVDIILSTDRF
jgi:hypothetical protein